MTADEDEVRRLVVGSRQRVESFLEALRDEGVHVGVGPKGSARCATCDELWPCSSSRAT